ncbi:MAG: hypothetical protein ACLFWF_06175 [Alphaproteobacteria bacterium]
MWTVVLAMLALTEPLTSPFSAEPEALDRACVARLASVSTEGVQPYAPFDHADGVLDVDLGITQPGECDLRLTFRSVNRNRMIRGKHALDYRLQAANGQWIETDGVNFEMLNTLRQGRTAQAIEIFAIMPEGQWLPPGVYIDRLIIQLYDGDRLLNENETRLAALVVSQATIQVAGSASAGFGYDGGASLDFGRLESGEEKSVYLFVQSNAKFLLNLSSEHQGRMTRVDKGFDGAFLDYDAWIDSRALDLRSPVSFRPGGLRRRPLELRVRIGDVAGKPAGDYRDTITVDVVLLE